jgi:hypothetical protein
MPRSETIAGKAAFMLEPNLDPTIVVMGTKTAAIYAYTHSIFMYEKVNRRETAGTRSACRSSERSSGCG